MLQMYLHDIKLDGCLSETDIDELWEDKIENYLVCLPVSNGCLSSFDTTLGKYYIIESNWMELDENIKITIAQA